MSILTVTAQWPVPHVSGAIIGLEGTRETIGDPTREFGLASVSKLLTGYAIMIGVEEGAVFLDDEAGPPGATLRHLLAHTSGLGFNRGDTLLGRPGARRGYSNAGIEEAAAHLATAAAMPFGEYLQEAVLDPLGMRSTRLADSPASGITSTAPDLVTFANELFAPQLIAPQTLGEMVTVQFPATAGVMPGVGRFDPLDWGLAFERTFGRPGHWAGQRVSTQAFGHFGAGGTFFWLDPVAQVACVCLTDRDFGDWSLAAWPGLCDAVILAATT